jgi:hypothetical protein
LKAETPNPFSGQMWLELFEEAFLNDPELAEKAAKLWRNLLTQIESGPEGITRARQALENAIRLTFPYTEAYKTCRDLFEGSLAEPPFD